ncbi:hypothetical protein [Luteimonas sp. SDU82]|uniref:hypothetical protein n=1 Tax=Luteimonas sp. SDU82 TaxID=3422592 RepID=UPI003EBE993A
MSTSDSREILTAVLEMMHLLDDGEIGESELRKRLQDTPGAQVWVDLAVALHECPKDAAPTMEIVKNPRFRKGTGRQPISWSNCLWQPQGVRS